MLTRWGARLDRDLPLPEHPRPQLVRAGWQTLNGVWEHAFTTTPERPASYDGPIVVPFSPETVLSGLPGGGRQLLPEEWLWYRRTFEAPSVPGDGSLLLHFGAVDQCCTVWVNGHPAGSHVGGYLPFTLEVTDLVRAGENLLEVRVRDLSETSFHARGKQRLDRGTIWYTAQSGIWQTVWLETVPASYVEGLVLVPHLDTAQLEVTVEAAGAATSERARVVVRDGGRVVAEVGASPGVPTRLVVPDPHPWSPDDPHLYGIEVIFGDDVVTSYAALRSFGVGRDDRGHPRLLLNGEPFVPVGVLDQGYWPDGLMTAPADAAMVHDLETMRSLGFTLVRKHAKVEPLRWYHHCDRIGLLVFQDVVNGGGRYRALTTTRPARWPLRIPDRWHRLYGRQDPDGRRELRQEVRDTVALLRNAVSVVLWTPFNEGWGQFDANAIAAEVARLDPTRPVNHVSGWVDQGGGNVRSFHSYLRPFRMPRRRDHRVVALTEYGGLSLRVESHDWSDREFGYRHCDDAEELRQAFTELHQPLVEAVRQGLGALVYTQLSDVEDELNGLLTWDREVLKIDAATVRRVTAELAGALRG